MGISVDFRVISSRSDAPSTLLVILADWDLLK